MGAIFNVGIFMSPVQEMKDLWGGECIFYGSLPQETGGLRVNTYDKSVFG